MKLSNRVVLSALLVLALVTPLPVVAAFLFPAAVYDYWPYWMLGYGALVMTPTALLWWRLGRDNPSAN